MGQDATQCGRKYHGQAGAESQLHPQFSGNADPLEDDQRDRHHDEGPADTQETLSETNEQAATEQDSYWCGIKDRHSISLQQSAVKWNTGRA